MHEHGGGNRRQHARIGSVVHRGVGVVFFDRGQADHRVDIAHDTLRNYPYGLLHLLDIQLLALGHVLQSRLDGVGGLGADFLGLLHLFVVVDQATFRRQLATRIGQRLDIVGHILALVGIDPHHRQTH